MSSNQQPATSYRIRVAEAADAEAITSVINNAFRGAENFFIDEDRVTLENVLAFLISGKFLLAEGNGIVTGCVYVEKRGDRAYLGLLAVDPGLQRSGLGSVLMNEAEEYCRRLGCRYMDIRIVNLRSELPAFYDKRGYRQIGTSPFPPDIETKLPCYFIEMAKVL
jgi:N-acetylglutamate synthase-like GNAT family acetyltransferase